MQEPTVADILEFESWPEEQRKIAQLVLMPNEDRQMKALQMAYDVGYNSGYRAGRAWRERNGESN